MTFQESEIIRCLLMLGVSLFALVHQRQVSQIPSHSGILLAFLCSLLGHLFSVIEGVQHPVLFNIIEHACHTASLVALCGWLWRVCGVGRN